PDGQAQLYLDGSAVGAPFTLTGGLGSITVAHFNNLIGAHTVQVNYLGSANYSTSNSGDATQTVNKAGTTTSLVASANPSVYGQDVTFTAFVTATAPGTGTPDGQAQLYLDGSTVGAPFTLTGGQGSITVAHFNDLIGAHTVQVDYLGSANYNTSNSGDATQTVNKAALTLAIVPSANPGVYGQPLTVTVSATAAQPGAGVPGGGTVTLQLGTYTAHATLTDGTATFSDIPAPVPGAYTVLATYGAAGDPHFQGGTATIMEAVTKGTSLTTLSASANPSAYGTPLTFTAIVAADAGAAIPSGSVVFWDGGNAIGSRSIIPGASIGTATLIIASLGAGVHHVWAAYSGDPNYKGSESAVDVQTVNPIATKTTLSSALNPSKYGQCAMLTATVQASGGTIQPTGGTVQFWDGTALLGSAALANSNQASLPICALAAGSHSLRAVWLASANYQTSTSGSIAQQVVKNQTVVQLGCAMAEPTETPGVLSALAAAAARVHRQVVFTILVRPAGAPAYLANEGTATIYQSNGRFVATLPVRDGQVTLSRYLCQAFQKSYYAVYNGTANLGRARSNMVRVTMSPVMAQAQSTPPPIVPKVTPAAPKATLALALHANRAAVLRKG
ncbi:MAG: Ig-like domain-containing protein, partial [Isosphaeraceae bacterium]